MPDPKRIAALEREREKWARELAMLEREIENANYAAKVDKALRLEVYR